MNTTRPRRSCSIPLDARFATRHEPARLVSTTSAKSSSDIRMISWSRVTPALATSTSTGPWLGLDLGEGGVDRGRVGDVAPHAGQALGRLAGPVGDGDPVARVGERPRDGQPDAAVATGDQDRAAGRRRGRRGSVAHGRDVIGLPPGTPTGRPAGRPDRANRLATSRVRVSGMRAIQVSRFGGPEVLELVDLPAPRAARAAAAARRQRSRRQLRRHPPGRRRLPGAAEGPVRPGRRGGRPRPRAAAGSWRCWPTAGTPSRRSRTRRRRSRCPTRSTTRPRWPWCCRAPRPGTCCAPAARIAPARRSSCTRPRAAWAAWPSSSPARWGPAG